MKKFIIFIAGLFLSSFVFSQTILKSVEEDYYDFLSIQGLAERPFLGYRTLSDSNWQINEEESIWKVPSSSKAVVDNKHIKISFFNPEVYTSYNTTTPYGYNDRGLWQGKGFNTYAAAGFDIKSHGLSVTFRPQMNFSQNLYYEIINSWNGNSLENVPYAYFNYGVDMPQRFGDKPFFSFDFADTEIRYTYKYFTVGFGTENPWLGPAYVNPMLGSNNAEGYPKFDIGLTKAPVIIPYFNIDLGYFEFRLTTGCLFDSDYYYYNSQQLNRMLNMVSISYAPSFIPNLTVGVNRIFLTNWKWENLSYIARLFTLSKSNGTHTGNDEDQKVSLFIDWTLPESGFEVYGELGIDDFTSNLNTNPFHTAIYTVGAKQYIPFFKGLKSELLFEFNDFEMSQDFQLQWGYLGYYQHGFVAQGYTNKGQILGAGTGAFGNSQYLEYKVYYPKGFASFYIHRFCPDNNSIYSKAVNDSANNSNSALYNDWYAIFETYYTLGIKSGYFITDHFYLEGFSNFTAIYCKNYVRRNDYLTGNFGLLLKILL